MLSVVPPVVLPVVLLAACRLSWLSFKGGATSGCRPAIGSAEHPFSSCVQVPSSTAAATRYLSYHLNWTLSWRPCQLARTSSLRQVPHCPMVVSPLYAEPILTSAPECLSSWTTGREPRSRHPSATPRCLWRHNRDAGMRRIATSPHYCTKRLNQSETAGKLICRHRVHRPRSCHLRLIPVHSSPTQEGYARPL